MPASTASLPGRPPLFPVGRLGEALCAVPDGAWSQASTFAETGVHHGYRRATKRWLTSFAWVLKEFAPVVDTWVSWINPGGFIVPHVDASPYYERWQVPICSAGVWFHRGVTWRHYQPFRVQHWEPHAVANATRHPRVHLVVDRDVVADRRSADMETFEPPALIRALMERSQHGASRSNSVVPT